MPNHRYYANGMRITEEQYKGLIETLKMYGIKYDEKTHTPYPNTRWEATNITFEETGDVNLRMFTENEEVDNVNSPEHYKQGQYETIEIIEDIVENFESYLLGNIIKYISRYKHKNGLEDLKKAQWYLNRLIEMEKDNDN